MVYFGVPVFDWVLLVILVGLAIEAYVTTRSSNGDPEELPGEPLKSAQQDAQTPAEPSPPSARDSETR